MSMYTGDWKDQYIGTNTQQGDFSNWTAMQQAIYSTANTVMDRVNTFTDTYIPALTEADFAKTITPNYQYVPESPYYGMSDFEVAMSKYGQLAAFINHPEIGHIIRNAAENGWGTLELEGALKQTSWWQNTNAAQRTWELLVNEDPAEAARLSAETAATIQNRARSMGLSMGSGAIQSLAWTATQNGWTDAQIVDSLVATVNWETVGPGDMKANVNTVKQIAAEYLVDVDETTARQYAQRIASGELTPAGVASAMKDQAKVRFTWMADQIDNGVTPSLYLAPLKTRIASELELPQEEINLMDPQWLSMVETRDDKTGDMRSATQFEATLAARRDERWANTKNAQDMTGRVTNWVRDMFGRNVS